MEHISQKETSFFSYKSQRKKENTFCEITPRAHARAHTFYTSKALINAPDENSRTRAVHAYARVRVCVQYVLLHGENTVFQLCRIRATKSRDANDTNNNNNERERERDTTTYNKT